MLGHVYCSAGSLLRSMTQGLSDMLLSPLSLCSLVWSNSMTRYR
jgi:hypothetical protein